MEFRILGPLEVIDAKGPVRVPGARERALLAYLLLRANETVAADRLIAELWGESPPASARKSLQVRVATLRKALGSGERLVTRSPGYMLRVEPGELDLHVFERLVARAERANLARSAELLRSALRLWRGTALADFTLEGFAQSAIRRLEEIRLVVLEKRIDADLALGQAADLIPELRVLVREHPLQERLRAQLMLALYRGGRQGEALDEYREARQALVEGLGIEPGAALRDLQQAILRQDPALSDGPSQPVARSLLVLVLQERALGALVELARTLAAQAGREVIIVRPVESGDQLASATTLLEERRAELLANRISARAVAFTSAKPADDVLRVVAEQDVDLLLVDAPGGLLDDDVLRTLLDQAPCDVAALIERRRVEGPVLVPFAGAEHDWAAVEIAAWAAQAEGMRLQLAGPSVDTGGRGRDASRLLASAALAVQRAWGISTEPVLVAPDPAAIVGAARNAGLVFIGLSDRWREEGLGESRRALVEHAAAPVLIVRRGLRPGGLAPPKSSTHFSWTILPAG